MWRLSAGPARIGFDGVVVGDADGIGTIGVGFAGRVHDSARNKEGEGVDFDVFVFFLALVDGVGEDAERAAVGRE